MKTKIIEIEQDNLYLKHENEKLRNELSELKIALQTSYQNCDRLLAITKSQSVDQTVKIDKTLK